MKRLPRLVGLNLFLLVGCNITGSSSKVSSNFHPGIPFYPAYVAADSPVGYWRLGESASLSPAADQSGNNNSGSFVGGVTLGVSGPSAYDPDTSVLFDGGTGYVSVPRTTSLDISGSISLEAWIQPDNVNQLAQIVGSFSPLSPYTGLSMSVSASDSNLITPGKQISCYFRTNAFQTRGSYTIENVIDGNWHHIVCVFDQSSDGDRIFVDGVSVATLMDHNVGAWPDPRSGLAYLIGTDGQGDFLQGKIDEVAIYNSALPSSRILSHYRAGLGLQ